MGKIKHVSLAMVVLAEKLGRKCLFRTYSHFCEEMTVASVTEGVQ